MKENEFPQIAIELERGITQCPPEIAARIDELISTTNRILYIAINGSSINVGKTYMNNLVRAHLMSKSIHFTGSGPHALIGEAIKSLQHLQKMDPKPHPGIIVSDNYQMNGLPQRVHKIFRESIDQELRERSEGVLQGVDLWIGTERKDYPFIEKAVADILVRNLGAKNK